MGGCRVEEEDGVQGEGLRKEVDELEEARAVEVEGGGDERS